jgi:tripartite motif-containing protein 71
MQIHRPSTSLFIATALPVLISLTNASAVTAQFQYVASIGSLGSGDDGLNAETGIAARPHIEGGQVTGVDVFMADTGNNRIQTTFIRPTLTGRGSTFAAAIAGTAVGKVSAPRGVDVDDQGRLFVADTGNNRIQVNNNGLSIGWAVVGEAGTTVGHFNAPRGVSSSADSLTLFVADTGNNRIQRGTRSSASDPFTWTIIGPPGTGVGAFNQPTGVRFEVNPGSTEPHLFIADTGNNRIQRATFHATGDPDFDLLMGPGTALGQVSGPRSIILDNDVFTNGLQRIFVADTGNNRIQMSTDAGASWSLLAGPGTGAGQVSSPSGLAMADVNLDGRLDLIVADTGNNRLLIFAAVPEPASILLALFGSATIGFRRTRRFAIPRHCLRLAKPTQGAVRP